MFTKLDPLYLLLDNTLIREMGWSPKTTLAEGLTRTYEWFLENMAESAN